MASRLADTLNRYVQRSSSTPGRLAKLSGIPKETIINWLEGRVRKPRTCDMLLRLAHVLHLNEIEATELLQAAGYPTIAELWSIATTDQERALLSLWIDQIGRSSAQAPFQVPADLPHFVGREDVIQTLQQALSQHVQPGIYVLQGIGGVGKTVLAAHIAYQCRASFPDGVLWAQLNSSSTMSILSAFANSYGCDVSSYTDIASRSQRVRDLLAKKRALIVLDDAGQSDEVVPLLPPTGSCAVIITTRRNLFVSRGAMRLVIDPFDPQKGEALALFAKLLGPAYIQQEHDSLAAIATILGHHPLAVDIVACRLAYEPDWSATDFLVRLQRASHRLAELTFEHQHVRLSFSTSYEALTPDQRQFFVALGVFGGREVALAAIAYVTGMSVEAARDNLRGLYGLSLVQKGCSDRYQLHPLLQDFVMEHTCDDVLYERMVTFFIDYLAAYLNQGAMLDWEESNILAAFQVAYERGLDSLLIRGAGALGQFLETRGMYQQAIVHLERAEQAARRRGDDAGLAMIILRLGTIWQHSGDYGQAETCFQEGLLLSNGDMEQYCVFLAKLGRLEGQRGNYHHAEAYSLEGLMLTRAHGCTRNSIALLLNLGAVTDIQGDYDRAVAYYEEGLALAQQSNDRRHIALFLQGLGSAAGNDGDLVQARRYFQKGLDLARELGDRERICALLQGLGNVAAEAGAYVDAATYYQENLQLAREIGHPLRISAQLASLGHLAFLLGDNAQAETYYQEGLHLAQAIGHRWLIADILGKWGALRIAQQQWGAALAALREACQIAYAIGLPDSTLKRLDTLMQAALAQDTSIVAERQLLFQRGV